MGSFLGIIVMWVMDGGNEIIVNEGEGHANSIWSFFFGL
jgi:hypothetical protein